MAVYQITNRMLLDNYAVVQTLLPTEIVQGQQVTIAGIGVPFNGTFTVIDCPQYRFIGVDDQGELHFDGSQPIPNQVLYACTGADVDLTASGGTLTYNPVCTWITGDQIGVWAGVTIPSADEAAFLDQCAAAANEFCWRRRQECGYLGDTLTTPPNGSCELAAIMYGGALWRQRGSIDQFGSFNEMGTAPVVGLSPIIKQLLGLGRPQVA